MSKRIYIELQDSRKLAAVAKKTGISPELLKRVAQGKGELSASDQKKVSAALKSG